MDSAKQFNLLKLRIPYNVNVFEDETTYRKVLDQLLDDSKYIALSIRYPYKDYSNMELPLQYMNWQLRCCVELYNQIGNQGIKSYSENGLSWTKDSSYISDGLRQEIESTVGYIEEENENV